MSDRLAKVSATEANREFSKLFRRAKDGETIIVTDRGEDAVIIAPIRGKSSENEASKASREAARQQLLARLRSQPVLGSDKFKREDIYDEIV